jgi:hypothetical protein
LADQSRGLEKDPSTIAGRRTLPAIKGRGRRIDRGGDIVAGGVGDHGK